MTAVRRLFFGSVVLLVFMAGGFAAGAGETRNGRRDLTGDETKSGPCRGLPARVRGRDALDTGPGV